MYVFVIAGIFSSSRVWTPKGRFLHGLVCTYEENTLLSSNLGFYIPRAQFLERFMLSNSSSMSCILFHTDKPGAEVQYVHCTFCTNKIDWGFSRQLPTAYYVAPIESLKLIIHW